MQKQKNLSGRTAALFVLVFGLVFAGIGAGLTYYSYMFSQTAVATSGIVTDVTVNRSSGSNNSSSSVTYQPTISFTDQNGAAQSAQTFLSSSGYNYARGTKLNILYDPNNPGSIRIESWFALWGFGLIFLAAGLGTMLISLFVFRSSKKRSAAQAEAPLDAPEVKKASYSYSSNQSPEGKSPEDHRRETETKPTVRRG